MTTTPDTSVNKVRAWMRADAGHQAIQRELEAMDAELERELRRDRLIYLSLIAASLIFFLIGLLA